MINSIQEIAFHTSLHFFVEPAKKKTASLPVTDFEISIGLDAYQKCSDLGWEEVLKYIQNQLRAPVKEISKRLLSYIRSFCNPWRRTFIQQD